MIPGMSLFTRGFHAMSSYLCLAIRGASQKNSRHETRFNFFPSFSLFVAFSRNQISGLFYAAWTFSWVLLIFVQVSDLVLLCTSENRPIQGENVTYKKSSPGAKTWGRGTVVSQKHPFFSPELSYLRVHMSRIHSYLFFRMGCSLTGENALYPCPRHPSVGQS
jgi:hypothetical protein